jgi:hypothetical protein
MPDMEDIYRLLKTVPAPKPTPEDIYADVMLARSFLSEAQGRCFNHGRHSFIPASDAKKIAEDFVGRSLNDIGFVLGLRMAGLQSKISRTDKTLLVKLPPLDRFEEVRELWNQRQVIEQKQIDAEVKRWADFRVKHPSYRPH